MCRRDLATRKVVSYGEGLKEEGSDGSSVISYNSIAPPFPCHRSLAEQTSYIWNLFSPLKDTYLVKKDLWNWMYEPESLSKNVLIFMARETNLNQEKSYKWTYC